MFAFDLCLSITKVTILTKPVSNTDLALKLETEKIIYVSTTGDDSNNGLTEITAKKTIQGALEEAKQYINNQNTTIKVGSGHYYITEPIQINNSYTSGSKGYTLKIEGYSNPDAILLGVESRTSSPVRIPRDENGLSKIKGLYPCGEGCGYAGGITTAAIDGLKTAENLVK
jgi:hypothetical protein